MRTRGALRNGVVLAVGIAAAMRPGSAPAAGTPQRIVYALGHDVTRDLVTVSPDGSGSVTVAAGIVGTWWGTWPSWAPSRKSIVFDGQASPDSGYHLWSIGSDGTGLRQLTFAEGGPDGQEFNPSLSQNGKQLTFERYMPGLTDSVFVANADGTGERQLTTSPGFASGGWDGEPSFSTNGQTIAFSRQLDGSDDPERAIFLIDVDGRNLRQLTPYSLRGENPRWSPNGKQIVFNTPIRGREAALAANIWVVNADGSDLREVTTPQFAHQYTAPDWSPDGRQIVCAFESVYFGLFQLRVMNADGSNEHVIVYGGSGDNFSFPDTPRWNVP